MEINTGVSQGDHIDQFIANQFSMERYGLGFAVPRPARTLATSALVRRPIRKVSFTIGADVTNIMEVGCLEEEEQSMIPNTKISQTVLEFGEPLILQLPDDHSKEDFEMVISLVIMAWNAVVMDGWDKSNRFETELLSALEGAPKEAQAEMQRLLKRKKTKFPSDPRTVGKRWVREQDGGYVFGCEALLSVENAPAEGTRH